MNTENPQTLENYNLKKIKGDGELKMEKDASMESKEEQRKIAETLHKVSSKEEE